MAYVVMDYTIYGLCSYDLYTSSLARVANDAEEAVTVLQRDTGPYSYGKYSYGPTELWPL